MNNEEHDDLWQLLGRAKKPVPSAFFSRNILRAIRVERQDKVGVLAWLRSRWQVLAVSACSMVIAGFMLAPNVENQSGNTTMILAEKVSQSTDFQVIIDFDELLASEENSAWLDN